MTGIVARAGSDELGLDPMGLNQTDTYLLTKPPKDWRRPDDKEWMLGELRKVLDNLPGISYSFTQPIDMRVQEMIIGVRGDVVVKIFGPDIPVLNKLAGQITTTLKSVPGSEDVRTVLNEGVQYLSVAVDRLQAGRLGLSVDDIADGLRAQIEGRTVGIVVESGRRTPVLLRGANDERGASATFGGLKITLPSGQVVPLGAVATLERVDGPVKIDRENGRRMALVQSNVRGRDLVGFVEEAKKVVSTSGFFAERLFAGMGRPVRKSAKGSCPSGLCRANRFGIDLSSAFHHFWIRPSGAPRIREYPVRPRRRRLYLVGIRRIPVCACLDRVHRAAWHSRSERVGARVLFQSTRSEGSPIDEVVVNGALRRLRPVLLTASITAFGLVPLLFATGPGSEVQTAVGHRCHGGLVSSTLLTLIILPLLYRRFGGVAKGAK